MYRSDIMVWREKERSRTRAVELNSLRGSLGIRRIDRIMNARVRELVDVKKEWFGYIERTDNSRITKRVSEGNCTRSRPLDQQQND